VDLYNSAFNGLQIAFISYNAKLDSANWALGYKYNGGDSGGYGSLGTGVGIYVFNITNSGFSIYASIGGSYNYTYCAYKE
jgi:hypothetical protein